MGYIGVNIGALTVKVAAVRGEARQARVVAHLGRPEEVLEQLLASPEFAGAQGFGISGHRGHISEVAAIQRALQDGLRHRALRSGGAALPVWRPLQPIRERLEAQVAERSGAGPGGTKGQDAL